jgi:16S rRNA (uracil1498-N3)-methyltransferase
MGIRQQGNPDHFMLLFVNLVNFRRKCNRRIDFLYWFRVLYSKNMQLFYAPVIDGRFVTLSKTESNHCIGVLRHSIDDTVQLTDGKGGIYTARIVEADPHACKVEITGFVTGDAGHPKLHLAIAPPKHSDRFEWFLEKAVELGAGEITPILCQRSVRREIKPERLEKIITASMKQAIVAERPLLNAMIAFPKFINTVSATDKNKFIAWCDESLKTPLQELLVKGNDAILLIGPEGDFTPEEIQLAMASGFKPVTLGSRRLRTETASLAGCMVFNIINS